MLLVNPDLEYLIIGSSIVRAHQHAAGAKGGTQNQTLDRSRGGLMSKTHLAIQGVRQPLLPERYFNSLMSGGSPGLQSSSRYVTSYNTLLGPVFS